MGTKVLRRSMFSLLVILLTSPSAQGLVINPNYVNAAGETWTPTRQGVIDQAIADWESAILDDHTVEVTLTFENAGGAYLGYWSASASIPLGTDIYPWTSGVDHTITFDVYLFSGTYYTWWDQSPQTDDDIPFLGYDALTVARHEVAHMMGFTEGLYVDNCGPSELDRWLDHITGTTFDPGGLDVSLASPSDLTHVLNSGPTAGDLMTPYQVNGTREDISMTDLLMLELAHGYTIIPEPMSLSLFGLVGLALIRSRKVRAHRR